MRDLSSDTSRRMASPNSLAVPGGHGDANEGLELKSSNITNVELGQGDVAPEQRNVTGSKPFYNYKVIAPVSEPTNFRNSYNPSSNVEGFTARPSNGQHAPEGAPAEPLLGQGFRFLQNPFRLFSGATFPSQSSRLFGLNPFSLGQIFTPRKSSLWSLLGNPAPTANLLFSNEAGHLALNSTAVRRLGFAQVGRNPGISDDGKLVVFAGDRGQGSGVFLSYDSGDGFTQPILLAGENSASQGSNKPELGYDALGDALFFESIELDSPLNISALSQGATGLRDDSIVITFKAQPNAASVDNPAIPGVQPFLFSEQAGLWRVRVDFKGQSNAPQLLALNQTSPLPVVQIGDVIDGSIVNQVGLYPPAVSQAQQQNFETVAQLKEHQIAFYAETTAGDRRVQASFLDSDRDGLLNHWETNGIDIDGDGEIDVDLARMGADPHRKDIFLEIDWLTPRKSGAPEAWSNEPSPGVIQKLVDMFADAPVTNPDGSKGITLHVDAGPGLDAAGQPFSINMGDAELQGGDEISPVDDPNGHVDIVYFGPTDSVVLTGVETRSFQDIKDNFFGIHDKRAREILFRYMVLADFHSFIRDSQGNPFSAAAFDSSTMTLNSLTPLSGFNLVGKVVKITSGTGAGQIRLIANSTANQITVSSPWLTVPDSTSQFTLIENSSGVAEEGFRTSPTLDAIPGNDVLVTLGGFGVEDGRLGNPFVQWRTMAHELGHTFGLLHGGTDHVENKPMEQYQSLMSYSHQVNPNSSINSYAGAEDPTFNDWANLELDFQNAIVHLANTLGLGLGTPSSKEKFGEPAKEEEGSPNGDPISEEPSSPSPLIPQAIAPPSPPENSVTIDFSAVDSHGTSQIQISFDADGDGFAENREITLVSTSTESVSFYSPFITFDVTTDNISVGLATIDSLGGLKLASSSFSLGSDGSITPTPTYQVTTDQAKISEGGQDNPSVTFTVTRSSNLQEASSVDYSIGGQAKYGSDYNNISGTSGASKLTGTIDFASGEMTKTITLDVLDDDLQEADETIQVRLNPAKGGSSPAIATTVIKDDDFIDGALGLVSNFSPVIAIDPLTGVDTGNDISSPGFASGLEIKAPRRPSSIDVNNIIINFNTGGSLILLDASYQGGSYSMTSLSSTLQTLEVSSLLSPAPNSNHLLGLGVISIPVSDGSLV